MTTTLKARPAELNLALYAGDGITIAFAFSEGGSPWPTTGAWAAEIRSGTGAFLTSFTIVNDEANGVVSASLTGAQVRSLGNEAIYDLQQTPPELEPRTWYRGRITVSADVTRGEG